MNKKNNLKRKGAANKEVNTKLGKKLKKLSNVELNAYFKTYKNGFSDHHWQLFREAGKIVKVEKVLYPGCHRHITASLVFKNVVYVDNYKKIAGCFADPKVLEWVNDNKDYSEEPKIVFKCKNFESSINEKNEDFDLVISSSAGIVTTSCKKYLKKQGYFLVSDAHYDARMLSLDPNFQLTHVWNSGNEVFESGEVLKGHFKTKEGKKITKSQVQESIEKPKAKRSFKLQKEALFYLFRKCK